jgi:tRNA pseudouridine55 synthase
MRDRTVLSGGLLIDKPAGMTSHDVVREVRRRFGQREVGHTGTLDPFATGLLVLTLGQATRLGRFVESASKTYQATVTLGVGTSTEDLTGDVLEEISVPPFDSRVLREILRGLEGSLEQEVPSYSAVRVDGERLHRMARRGEAPTLRPRRVVQIHHLTFEGYDPPHLRIEAGVSKGTYIRTLGVEIGRRLGLPAHVSKLCRTVVGPHGLAQAHSLDALEGRAEELLTPRMLLGGLPEVRLDSDVLDHVRHGRPLPVSALPSASLRGLPAESPLILMDLHGAVAAVGTLVDAGDALVSGPPDARAMRYACVLIQPQEARRGSEVDSSVDSSKRQA